MSDSVIQPSRLPRSDVRLLVFAAAVLIYESSRLPHPMHHREQNALALCLDGWVLTNLFITAQDHSLVPADLCIRKVVAARGCRAITLDSHRVRLFEC